MRSHDDFWPGDCKVREISMDGCGDGDNSLDPGCRVKEGRLDGESTTTTLAAAQNMFKIGSGYPGTSNPWERGMHPNPEALNVIESLDSSCFWKKAVIWCDYDGVLR